MRTSRLLTLAIAGAIVAVVMTAAPSFAQRAGSRAAGGSPRAAAPVGRAVPRGGGVAVGRPPGAVGHGRAVYGRGYGYGYGYPRYGYGYPYYGYGYGGGIGFGIGFGFGYGGFYGSVLYGGPFYGGYYGGYPYGYRGYWGPGYAYPYAAYGAAPYGYAPSGYAAPDAVAGSSSVSAAPVRAISGLRLTVPQREAEVRLDGVYVGIVDDFNSSSQPLPLEAGQHRIEISQEGFEPVAFDINVEPGRTVTYRTRLRPLEP